MADFSDIKEKIEGLDQLSRIADSKRNEMLEASFPEDYVDFLSQIGYGDLENLQLYSAPIKPDSVFPSVGDELKHVLLFGDDFQGYCFGFERINEMRVVEVSPKGAIDRSVEPKFESFIRGYFE
jgi:hypothetical protein